jgi:hypothetical protein
MPPQRRVKPPLHRKLTHTQKVKGGRAALPRARIGFSKSDYSDAWEVRKWLL